MVQFGAGSAALTGMNIRVGGNLATADKNNWGPQIGFSWQPLSSQGKAVLRGGFGINYNENEIAILANGFGNPPNAVNASFNCGYPYTTNPSCAGNGILYQTATSPNSIFGYPPNPAAITTFSSANLPADRDHRRDRLPRAHADHHQLPLLAGSGLPTALQHRGQPRL